MTLLSPRTDSPTGLPRRADSPAFLARWIADARRRLAVERLLPALWPALGFAGLYAGLALLGVFTLTPWIVQALLLAATITAIGLSLENGLADWQWPSWRDGARRLERDSGLAHRPISEGGDALVGNDPFAIALWRLHRARALPRDGLRLTWPDPDFTRRDPRHLRYFVALLLAVGLLVAGGAWRARLAGGFDSGAGLATSLDAWIDPPAYTGLAPLYLIPGSGPVAVPAGSRLHLRAHGAGHAPGLALGGGRSAPGFHGDEGEYAADAAITADSHVRIRIDGHAIGDWRLHVIPDHVPVIGFDGVPGATQRQAMRIGFHASDDYGVTGARLILTPHGRTGAPLAVDLPVAAAKKITQTSYVDLTGHSYAGLLVDARLEARDGAGQTGVSRSITFRLPARIFTDPLARALIEQRQNLATSDAQGRRAVAIMLDALATAPDRFYPDKPALYLGLRAAYWALAYARGPADLTHVEDLLWQMAVSLEQNGLLDAAAELRRLQALITTALIAHAPQDVIDQLLERYNQAMQRYLQALAANPQGAPAAPPGGNAKTLEMKDLDALMKAIQQMTAAGDREGAARALAMLQNLLENMHIASGSGSGAGGGAQNKALNDAIQKFGDLMGKQRSLMDKTMRQRAGNGDPRDGGAQGLSRQQNALRRELDQTMKSLDPKLGGKLGPAGEAMDRAQQALGRQDLDNAGNDQKNALDALRKGADELARQGQNGQSGENGDNDPLGRARGGAGGGVRIPDVSDLARARAMLEELRKRAGERGRPQEELDYFDRLLKEF